MLFFCYVLTLIYILDRIVKSILIFKFFWQKNYFSNPDFSSVSLLQPITRGATDLRLNLISRLHQNYQNVEHVWICDEKDGVLKNICEDLKNQYPQKAIRIVLVKTLKGEEIADKIQKLNSGLQWAKGDILVSIDDDIALREDGLQKIISFLRPKVGAVFGLACGISYGNFWSGMMSSFVNANAFMTYVPATYFLEPYTITGHFFAVRRSDFENCGGFGNMEGRLDDDHELARRLNAIGLKLVQSPVCYAVSNELNDFKEFGRQIKRWFVFPKKAMSPYLTIYQQLVSLVLSVGLFLPFFILFFTLIFPSYQTVNCLIIMFMASMAGYNICYFHNPFRNWKSWLYIPLVVFLLPLHILWAYLLANNKIYWRGRKLEIKQGGEYEEIKK